MSDDEHRELAATLNECKGKVAVSNYDCALMDELYPSPGWHKFVSQPRTNHATKGQRVEVLWTNYDPLRQENAATLFE
jgi:DNA adenine methylase